MTGPIPPVDPARVHALVVGIERYEAGDAWGLPGPARDAVRFWRLLRESGVPEYQLRLHLSPLPPYDPLVPYRSADQATLRRVLVRELSPAQGDMLWVWWGGHGVLDRAGRLRLFCADAGVDDKVGIDLDSALARYAGDAVPGLREQMWIVDACETFEEALEIESGVAAICSPPIHHVRQAEAIARPTSSEPRSGAARSASAPGSGAISVSGATTNTSREVGGGERAGDAERSSRSASTPSISSSARSAGVSSA